MYNIDRNITLREYMIQLTKTPETPDPENEYGPVGMIDMARTFIFDFDYPMWSDDDNTEENNKRIFETKFLKNFYFRELCYPDVKYWKLELDGVMNLIMPYYSDLMESETWFRKYINNPAENTDWREEYTREIQNSNTRVSDGTSSAASDGTQSGQSSSQNTVTGETETNATAGNVVNDLPKTQYDDGTDYASATTKNVSESTGTSSSTDNGTATTSGTNHNETEAQTHEESEDTGTTVETFTTRRVGNIGVQTPGEVFEKTRLAFINVTREIFADPEVQQLFMMVF